MISSALEMAPISSHVLLICLVRFADVFTLHGSRDGIKNTAEQSSKEWQWSHEPKTVRRKYIVILDKLSIFTHTPEQI